MSSKFIRNIGIIAHVDHGKTTLVDELLKQSGTYEAHQDVGERVMDSMDLEREKGITIRAKNTAVEWGGHTINIVDTPGHADFGAEVERILKMVDGVMLLVDAQDGPQAQTRFVLRKAIAQNLKLIVFVNKIDKEFATPDKVHEMVMELLLDLEASEDQFACTFLYGSAKNGFAVRELSEEHADMTPLFETIISDIPAPSVKEGPFEMLVSNLDWSDYVGRIGIGKITGGEIKIGDPMFRITHKGERQRGKVTKLYKYTGSGTIEIQSAIAGDIAGVAGMDDLDIGETLVATEAQDALPFVAIDPPTLTMQFVVNDGPFAGKDGKFVTARNIGNRLQREGRTNISFQVGDVDRGNMFTVQARGELQIAVVAETMRREGFEVCLSRPEVIKKEINGKMLEPYEDLWLEVPADCLGVVMEQLSARKAKINDMQPQGSVTVIRSVIPTRGLIGLESGLANTTRGEAVASHSFREYGPNAGEIATRNTGSMISTAQGQATAYALDSIQQRGKLLIAPGDEVYVGMVIGESSRNKDLPVNPTRAKQLTNVRASGTDKAISLEPPEKLSLERAIEFIADDEYVEATPSNVRIRKRLLDPHARKKASR